MIWDNVKQSIFYFYFHCACVSVVTSGAETWVHPHLLVGFMLRDILLDMYVFC
jgi:hypothetical protein